MPRSGDMIVVHMVDDVAPGYRFERRRMKWPLHITLAPWFTPPDDREIDVRLQQTAARSRSFTCEVGDIEIFGPRHDVPVNVLRASPELQALQQRIFTTLQDAGVVFAIPTTSFMPDKYIAHITRHEPDGHYAHAGDMQELHEFHTVTLLDGNICEVVKPYTLGL